MSSVEITSVEMLKNDVMKLFDDFINKYKITKRVSVMPKQKTKTKRSHANRGSESDSDSSNSDRDDDYSQWVRSAGSRKSKTMRRRKKKRLIADETTYR